MFIPRVLIIFKIVTPMLSVVSTGSFLRGVPSAIGSSLLISIVSFALLDSLLVFISLSSPLSAEFVNSVAHCLFVLLFMARLVNSLALFWIIFGIAVATFRWTRSAWGRFSAAGIIAVLVSLFLLVIVINYIIVWILRFFRISIIAILEIFLGVSPLAGSSLVLNCWLIGVIILIIGVLIRLFAITIARDFWIRLILFSGSASLGVFALVWSGLIFRSFNQILWCAGNRLWNNRCSNWGLLLNIRNDGYVDCSSLSRISCLALLV